MNEENEFRDWFEEKYVKERLTQKEIAKLIGCDVSDVSRSLKELGIKIRSNSETALERFSKLPKKPYMSYEFLNREYIEKKRSIGSIARECGVSPPSIRYFLKKLGISIRNEGKFTPFSNRFVLEKDYLIKKYVDERLSLDMIANELGCSSATIFFSLERFGIERRGKFETISETRTRLYREGKIRKITGENCYNWKGGVTFRYGPIWREVRRRTLERDNFVCQHCGDISPSKTVHHRIPASEFLFLMLGLYGDDFDYPKLLDMVPNSFLIPSVIYEEMNQGGNLTTLCNHPCHQIVEMSRKTQKNNIRKIEVLTKEVE